MEDENQQIADDQSHKWYRVCLNTIVRKEVELDSQRLRILPMGSRVRVIQVVERRVKIDQPIEGWCSLTSSNGDQIMHPLDSEDLAPTTPQMRSRTGKVLLANQMKENEALLETKGNQKNEALENPEIKILFEDIQTIRNQLKKTEAQTLQLQQEEEKQKHNEKNKEINALRLEEYNEKLKIMKANLVNKQEEIQRQAEQAGVENPDKLQGDLDRLQQHNDVLEGEVKHNESILQQLQHEAAEIANMMEQYVQVNSFDGDKVLKGDVLYLGGKFGMAVVGDVCDQSNVYALYLENPIDNALLPFWNEDWPPLCNGLPILKGYAENQCFMLPKDHELTKKFLTGSQLLIKLEAVMGQVYAAQMDGLVD